MQINGTSNVHGPHGINAPHFGRTGGPQQAAPPAQTNTDQLDISPAAQAAVKIAEGTEEVGEIRADLVARLRSEIADGTYDTPQRLDQALASFLDEQA